MNQSENFTKAISALQALTAAELNDLVPHWKAIAKHKRSIAGAVVLAKNEFNPGDVVTFVKSGSGRHAGRHYFIFKNINRAGTCAQGLECDSTGKQMFPTTKWTVALTNIKKV